MTTTVDTLAPLHADMTAWRRDIHAHPELGFQETRTADRVAALLQACGIDVTRGVGKTGVVGTLKLGSSPRRIGLRADMDALPMQEGNPSPTARHHRAACTPAATTATPPCCWARPRTWRARRTSTAPCTSSSSPPKKGLGGAKAMIDDGLFTRFPCDSIFGMHNRPKLEVGRFNVKSGPMMAGGAFFDIRITGRGSHGARPETSVDAALVAAQVAVSLQSIVARNVAPLDSAVLSRHPHPRRRRLQRDPADGRTGRHGARVLARGDGRRGPPHEARGRRHGRGLRRHRRSRLPRALRAHGERPRAGRVRGAHLHRPGGRRQGRPQPAADHGVGRLLVHAGAGAGLLHQHRQRPGRRRLRGAQPRLRLQRPALPLGAAFFVRLVETQLAR
jgi:hypothetical protein